MALSDLDRMTQERDYFKAQLTVAMKGSRRLLAAMELATAYTWTTADGKKVRVNMFPGVGWYVAIDDAVAAQSGKSLNSALDFAARIAPPADSDLAALLTWTACGKARV